MKTSIIEFPFPTRRVFTACKNAIKACGIFRSIKIEESVSRITASKGFPIFGEDIIVNVKATASDKCQVILKSSDKLLFNIFKFGNNIRNVSDLSQFISNEVYKCCSQDSIRFINLK